MDVEKQENGNIVFNYDNGSYTFVNMGSYVGYRSREWYEKAPSCWKLMFFDENKEEYPVHIEALVDTNGDYSRILVKQGEFKRVLLLYRSIVDEDTIYEEDPNNLFVSKNTYVAFEDKYREKRHFDLESYLGQVPQFVSKSGEIYAGNITSNDLIVNFLNANIELSKRAEEVSLSDQRRM